MLQSPEHALSNIGLSFLEAHYKHRPKTDEEISKAANLVYNKTIVDGILNYKEQNGHKFFAVFKTFPSTVVTDKLFDVSRTKLIGYGCLVAGILAVCLYFLLIFITKVQYPSALLLLIWSPIFLGFYFFGLYSGYYRDLTFLDGLKKCQANEKWIAINDLSLMAFPKEEYEFLKEKCAHHGIGLFSISQTSPAELIVPPINQRRRKNRLSSSSNKFKWIKQFNHYLLPFLGLSALFLT